MIRNEKGITVTEKKKMCLTDAHEYMQFETNT